MTQRKSDLEAKIDKLGEARKSLQRQQRERP
jgi:hypothetical protein